MADNVKVELGGKSKYEVAYDMAERIFGFENKWPSNRQEYLKTVEQCMDVLAGGPAPD